MAAANQAVSAYLVQLDNSHCAASSANWNAAHHQAAFNKFNAPLPIFQALLAAIAHHTKASAGAVSAISDASSQTVSHTLYAHTSSDSSHCFHNSSELASFLACPQLYHLAFFILSHTVHSDTSAHNSLAAPYHISPYKSHKLLQAHSAAVHNVFCIIFDNHCAAHFAQALNLSQAFIQAVSTHQRSHSLAASHLFV